MPETLSATFRIVTPMFLGGADQSPSDGIRPPSVKGALRFWWRALNWGRMRGQTSCDEAALVLLHQEEARLFGAAARTEHGKEIGGHGCFLLSISHGLLTSTDKKAVHSNFQKHDAARYLGYGLIVAFGRADGPNPSGQLERSCLNEKQEFTVKLVFRNGIDRTVRDALVAWGLLGGLGSRSRHGMGSIAMVSLEGDKTPWTAPANADGYDQQVKALFSNSLLPTTEPPFSAFWRDSRIDRLFSGTDCYAVLNAFAKAMLMYRSWGRSVAGGGSAVLGTPSEQRFKDDHDWYRVPGWTATHPNFHPERVEFGLPHNYHKEHHHVTPSGHERRASPLFFHVHPIGNQYVGVSIYLPAQFLPDGEMINSGGIAVPAKIGWSVIKGFLDGKVGNPPAPGATARFPGKKALLP